MDRPPFLEAPVHEALSRRRAGASPLLAEIPVSQRSRAKSSITAPQARVTPGWFFCRPIARERMEKIGQSGVAAELGKEPRDVVAALPHVAHSMRRTSRLPTRPPIVPSRRLMRGCDLRADDDQRIVRRITCAA
jgi:hypothetical protein